MKVLVNIGSGNGLLSDHSKTLPKPMLTDHQQDCDEDTDGLVQDCSTSSVLAMEILLSGTRPSIHPKAVSITCF